MHSAGQTNGAQDLWGRIDAYPSRQAGNAEANVLFPNCDDLRPDLCQDRDKLLGGAVCGFLACTL